MFACVRRLLAFHQDLRESTATIPCSDIKLKSLCERYGIVSVEPEESYTNQSRFLDNDPIPIYNTDNPVEFKRSCKRIKRGLYQIKNSWLVNADVNGASNILRKNLSSLNGLLTEQNRGCLAQH